MAMSVETPLLVSGSVHICRKAVQCAMSKVQCAVCNVNRAKAQTGCNLTRLQLQHIPARGLPRSSQRASTASAPACLRLLADRGPHGHTCLANFLRFASL